MKIITNECSSSGSFLNSRFIYISDEVTKRIGIPKMYERLISLVESIPFRTIIGGGKIHFLDWYRERSYISGVEQ